MHNISCNSHCVVMDTGEKREVEKEKKTSFVSIATETSLVQPKMV